MTIQHHKVLVIDDNIDMLEVLKEILTFEDYSVSTYTEVDDILKVALEEKPDLVIVDYLLSGINGGEYCHQLKTNELTAHIPVIILSAHPRVLSSLGNYGADCVIAKPFSNDEVIDNVRALLNHQPAR